MASDGEEPPKPKQVDAFEFKEDSVEVERLDIILGQVVFGNCLANSWTIRALVPIVAQKL